MHNKQELELPPKKELFSPKLHFFKPHPLAEELLRELPQLLKHYEGKLVDITTLPSFQQDGMKYYTDFKVYDNTDIGITLKVDITKKAQTYRLHYAAESGASFSLYLLWTLIQSMQQISGFNFRYIGGRWYEFNNLPLFTTLEVEGEINNFVFTDVVRSTWTELCQQYLSAKNNAESKAKTNTYAYSTYAVATHITNISLPFSALSIPTPKKGIEIERPMFVLGERLMKEDKIVMPFHAKIPHASLHPGLFRQLLSTWASIGENPLVEELSIKARL